jgi:hypothetical protein
MKAGVWLAILGSVAGLAGARIQAAPAEEVTWQADLKGLMIPERPASGHLLGKPFKVDKATFQNGNLTLQEGTKFIPDRSMLLFLFLPQGVQPDEKGYDIRPHYGGPHIHMRGTVPAGTESGPLTATGGYSMLLEFGKRMGNRLPGKIYLCMPDRQKSFVAGTFVAEIK